MGHRWGQFPTSGCKFNFPLCYPKGAHSLGHRWGQLLTSGAKFNFPLCYPKGAHSLGHRLGQLLTSGAKFNFSLCYPKGTHSLGHRLGQLLTSGAKVYFPQIVLLVNAILHRVGPHSLLYPWKPVDTTYFVKSLFPPNCVTRRRDIAQGWTTAIP